MPKAKNPNRVLDFNYDDLGFSKETLGVEKAVDQYIEALYTKGFCEDESENYENEIFEKAVEMVYGPDCWKLINKRIMQLK